MTGTSLFLQNSLDRLKRGDAAARDELVSRVSQRLKILAERMLRKYPGVARWEQADDILQEASIRLHRSLEKIVPESLDEFFALGALQLRRQLCDMARHYNGPEGMGANHASDFLKPDDTTNRFARLEPIDPGSNAETLAIWAEFHESVEQLPEIERRVFELLWYHDLTQAEAAETLKMSERQLRRHWQAARLTLKEKLNPPGKCDTQNE